MPEQNRSQIQSINDRLLAGQYLSKEEYSSLPDTSRIYGAALTYIKRDNVIIPVVAILADSWSKQIYDIAKKYREMGLSIILMHPSSDIPRIAYAPAPLPEELEPAIRSVTLRYQRIIHSIYSLCQ